MKQTLSALRHSLVVRAKFSRSATCCALLGACILTLDMNAAVRAEDDAMGMPDSTMSKKGNVRGKDALADELRALRKQVSDLRTAVDRQQVPVKRMKARRAGDTPAAAMPKSSGSMAMGSAPPMAMDSGEMGGMPAPQDPGVSSGAMSDAGNAPKMAMDDDMDMMGSPSPGSPGGMGSRGMPMDSGEMGGMGGGGSAPMPAAGNSGPNMKAMGCCMSGAGPGRSATSLPGFPGRSHLYHIGAEGFFLNHPQHIALTIDQKTRLNQIRETALLADATYARKVAEAEQALFVLTGSEVPDAARIEEQLRLIANLRSEQRMGFIRAVGDAAQVLTEGQRAALLGK